VNGKCVADQATPPPSPPPPPPPGGSRSDCLAAGGKWGIKAIPEGTIGYCAVSSGRCYPEKTECQSASSSNLYGCCGPTELCHPEYGAGANFCTPMPSELIQDLKNRGLLPLRPSRTPLRPSRTLSPGITSSPDQGNNSDSRRIEPASRDSDRTQIRSPGMGGRPETSSGSGGTTSTSSSGSSRRFEERALDARDRSPRPAPR